MLAQPRKIRLVARQTETTERELLASRLQACDRPVRHWGNPPEPVARSAEPRLSCGALVWFGIRRVPRRSQYGGLSFGAGPCRLERRYKLQPQLPGLTLGRRPHSLASQRKAPHRVGA